MSVDPTVVRQAREWIDRVDAGRGLSNSWRLQTIQKRFRRRDVQSDAGTALECDGESCVGLPMRIRRFVPGCPWALVDQAVRYLICKAPYEGLIYNGLEIPGRYRPTLTMWQRDEQSTVDEQSPRNGTYTLIQDLIEEGCEDEETVVTGETCSYVETTEYHWDDSVPGELPGCGPECSGGGACQGVTYAVRSNRNEDGSFDWQLVKRVAKTQHAGPFDVECGECSDRVTQELWDNLYGDPVSGYEARYGADCPGEPVALPGCDDRPGVRTQVQVSQNPDCTYKVAVTVRTSLEQTEEWEDGTPCRRRRVVESRNLRERPPVPEPAVGETVRFTLKRNDDCTYDAQTEVNAAVEPYAYSWTDGSDCRPREVVVLRDQKEMPEVPPVGPGETLEASITRNQDCTWDAQFSIRKPAVEAVTSWDEGTSCGSVRHVMSYQNSAVRPDVPKPSPGETVSASIRRNDDCSWDGQVTVQEAKEIAGTDWSDGTCLESSETTVVRNAKSLPAVDPPAEGRSVSIRANRNDDCTYDYSVTVATSAPKDSGWVEWDSVDRGANSTMWYHNGIRLFYNYSADGMKRFISDVTGRGSHAYSVSFHMNADCTYSGSVSYRDLTDWATASGHEGGIHENDYYQTMDEYGNTWSIPKITFTGTGNEGTERHWKVMGASWLPAGVHLDSRTYAKYVKFVRAADESGANPPVRANPYAHYQANQIVSPSNTRHGQDNTDGNAPNTGSQPGSAGAGSSGGGTKK